MIVHCDRVISQDVHNGIWGIAKHARFSQIIGNKVKRKGNILSVNTTKNIKVVRGDDGQQLKSQTVTNNRENISLVISFKRPVIKSFSSIVVRGVHQIGSSSWNQETIEVLEQLAENGHRGILMDRNNTSSCTFQVFDVRSGNIIRAIFSYVISRVLEKNTNNWSLIVHSGFSNNNKKEKSTTKKERVVHFCCSLEALTKTTRKTKEKEKEKELKKEKELPDCWLCREEKRSELRALFQDELKTKHSRSH
mmetsp:Transcript_9433/g.14308  ORF Transcript_9433/g.14308 Transcript_9433/m.14308 type:complete len:250 (-) Transcript_9433:895-1644(-)